MDERLSALQTKIDGLQVVSVTFQNGPQLVLEWCLNSLVTFKTVKRFGNKKYKVWCQWLKLLSRSESKKLDPSVKIGQCLNILVLLQNKCVLDAR